MMTRWYIPTLGSIGLATFHGIMVSIASRPWHGLTWRTQKVKPASYFFGILMELTYMTYNKVIVLCEIPCQTRKDKEPEANGFG